MVWAKTWTFERKRAKAKWDKKRTSKRRIKKIKWKKWQANKNAKIKEKGEMNRSQTENKLPIIFGFKTNIDRGRCLVSICWWFNFGCRKLSFHYIDFQKKSLFLPVSIHLFMLIAPPIRAKVILCFVCDSEVSRFCEQLTEHVFVHCVECYCGGNCLTVW